MSRKLFYLPLEQYPERYTELMSCRNGWTETTFIKHGVDFKRIDGDAKSGAIKHGVVLDAISRSAYAVSQISKVISLIEEGDIIDGDIIYTEDFWHPGIETLFYIRAIAKVDFKIACFIHAQSIDPDDFCAASNIKSWMAPIEKGFYEGYDFIFTCSDILKGLMLHYWEDGRYLAVKDKIHKVGLPYNEERLLQQVKDLGVNISVEKTKDVIFSSRFDSEKNPHLFLDLVEMNEDIQFTLVNPRELLPISNDKTVVDRLATEKPENLTIVPTHKKHLYYRELTKHKVQFNCASQDWVSWTLLEAITFKCNPVYPNHRDFPFELPSKYIYEKGDLEQASSLIRHFLSSPFDETLSAITDKHSKSWSKYLSVMGVI